MSNIKELNDQDFASVISSSDKLVLVDFFTPTCRPCKAMMPTVKQVAKNYESMLSVYKVNISENKTVSSQNNVTGVPTLIIFNKGKEVGRKNGFLTGSQLKEWVESFK